MPIAERESRSIGRTFFIYDLQTLRGRRVGPRSFPVDLSDGPTFGGLTDGVQCAMCDSRPLEIMNSWLFHRVKSGQYCQNDEGSLAISHGASPRKAAGLFCCWLVWRALQAVQLLP
jgi:hypothetical protein